MPHEETVEVYWAKDAQVAHLVRAALESAGIEAMVEGEMLQAAAGDLPMGPAGSPHVRVRASDAQRARRICAEWDAARGAEVQEPWRCPHCDVDVDGDFDVCWTCTRPRSGQTP